MTVPALMSSCARAATAKEAAFRIDYPLAPARATRVVAFDTCADEVVRSVAGHEWSQAQFYSATDPGHQLVTLAGESRSLADALEGVDSLVMVAATGDGAEAVAGTDFVNGADPEFDEKFRLSVTGDPSQGGDLPDGLRE